MRHRAITWIASSCLAAGACGGSGPAPQDSAASGPTIEQLLAIRHPSQPVWSPDGSVVAFAWDLGGVQNVFTVASHGGELRALTDATAGLVEDLSWRPDGGAVRFGRDGDYYEVDRSGRQVALWSTSDVESGVTPSPDGARVAFSRGGDLWVRVIASGEETRLTDSPNVADGGAVWSPDGRRLAFVAVAVSPRSEAPAYSGAKLFFAWAERVAPDVGVVSVAGGRVRWVGQTGGSESAPRWLDAERLVLQRVAEDLRARQIVLIDVGSGGETVLHRDEDDKWWSLTYLGPEPVPSPDGRAVAFLSDRDGWDHAYVVPASGGEPVQLTHGEFEVSRLAWSPDGTRLAFDRNDADRPGVRHVAVVTVSGPPSGDGIEDRTTGGGTNTQPIWSPDGTRLLYQHTDPSVSADLYVIAGGASGAPIRLTGSMPDDLDREALVAPELVRYPSPDGQQVPAYLFVPNGLDRSRRHPAIVWVHGDGVTQNYDGWHVRRDYAVYYGFHQYLVGQGYVVLAVDYRGSIGYGKAWRQGHYRDLGGRDLEDVAAGVEFLGTLGYVDAARVGIWGLSYGGFLTLQALTVTPELFACGVDVAGVVDWRDWFRDPGGPWIRGRMGRPTDDPALYERTAPIERVSAIARPLLVLHGTADVNVPFAESVRLLDSVTKAGKPVEFMMYPGELHYFHRSHVLRDAWTRVAAFFDRHLRG